MEAIIGQPTNSSLRIMEFVLGLISYYGVRQKGWELPNERIWADNKWCSDLSQRNSALDKGR